jgi:hypothetical protein
MEEIKIDMKLIRDLGIEAAVIASYLYWDYMSTSTNDEILDIAKICKDFGGWIKSADVRNIITKLDAEGIITTHVDKLYVETYRVNFDYFFKQKMLIK